MTVMILVDVFAFGVLFVVSTHGWWLIGCRSGGVEEVLGTLRETGYRRV